MKRILLFSLCFFFVTNFGGCSDSSISKVKNGTLEFDKSLTVGQAIDKYKYFKKTKWESITTENGKKVVQVYGKIDTEKHPSLNSKELPDLKNVEMQFQFVINADNTFQLGWCGVHVERKDGTKKEPEQNANMIRCMNTLKGIYNNSPDI